MVFLCPVLRTLERCIQQTAEYCRERKAFGRSILDNQVISSAASKINLCSMSFCTQVIHYRLAELETEVELLRSLLYRTVGKCIAFKLHLFPEKGVV